MNQQLHCISRNTSISVVYLLDFGAGHKSRSSAYFGPHSPETPQPFPHLRLCSSADHLGLNHLLCFSSSSRTPSSTNAIIPKSSSLSSEEKEEQELIRNLILSPKQLTLLLKNQRDWRKTLRLFRFLRLQNDYTPNPIHYNVVLRTLGRAREWDELRLCWVDMARDGVLPTNNTYATLIDIYDKAGLRKEALLWIKHMRVRKMVPDEVTMNTIVRVLKDSGKFRSAEKFFRGWCEGKIELDTLEENNFNSNGDATEDGGKEIASGLSPKHFILTELFKSGGRPVFEKNLDTVMGMDKGGTRKPRLAATYNTLIDMYGKAGKLKEASESFAEMMRSGVIPDTTTFNTMINVCGTHGNLVEAEALFQKMKERRVLPDTKTFNIFITLYANAREIEKAMVFYQKIRDSGLKPDSVTNRIILKVLCGKKMVCEVESVFKEMERFNVRVEEQSLPVVMKMYVDCGLLQQGKLFLEKHCFSRVISSSNYAAIIDAYAEKGLWMEAEEVFNGKRNPGYKRDVVEYNVMIKAYGKAKLYDRALSLFEGMTSTGIWPDECTYNSLIQMLSGGDLLNNARALLAKMQLLGLRPRCETLTAVISCSTRAGTISETLEIYKEIKRAGFEINEAVYGSLINAFAESGKVEDALCFFRKMEESGIPANQIVITSLIKAYHKAGCWQKAQELYSQLKDLEGGPDIIASNSMIDLYADLGMIAEAEVIFNDLRLIGQADGISYATMMHLYKSMGMLDEAMEVSREMQQSGLLTDCSSFSIVMASYAANGQLQECGELLQQMQVKKILPDATTFKVMCNVLKKGGISSESIVQLESSYIDGKPFARQAIITSVFSVVGMHDLALESCKTFVTAGIPLDVSAYNAAIYAYGSSGMIDKALNLLIRMKDDGLHPDIVTYITLVGCYGNAGLVEGIKRIYSKLKYGEIEPNESLFKAIINAYKDAGKHDLADLVDQEMRFSSKLQMTNPENENQTDSDTENV